MFDPGGRGTATSVGERLSRDAYKLDFRQRQWAVDGRDSWKLERQQHFQEPGKESWEAFSRGDWEGSLHLIEKKRDSLAKFCRDSEEHGIGLYRVRMVEEPLTPYLQWELNSLRLSAECGERIRVLKTGNISAMEVHGPLPEVLTLGGRTVYEILYDSQGVIDGAVRYEDPELVARWEEFMAGLFAEGEDLSSYFERKIAPLPPPQTE